MRRILRCSENDRRNAKRHRRLFVEFISRNFICARRDKISNCKPYRIILDGILKFYAFRILKFCYANLRDEISSLKIRAVFGILYML